MVNGKQGSCSCFHIFQNIIGVWPIPKKTYPVETLSDIEEKELKYILSIEETISHEELMYLRYAKKVYEL